MRFAVILPACLRLAASVSVETHDLLDEIFHADNAKICGSGDFLCSWPLTDWLEAAVARFANEDIGSAAGPPAVVHAESISDWIAQMPRPR